MNPNEAAHVSQLYSELGVARDQAASLLDQNRRLRARLVELGRRLEARSTEAEQHSPWVQALISDAAEAIEVFGEDELERFARSVPTAR